MKIIAGKYRGRNLKVPSTLTLRPSVSLLKKTLFDICQSYVENALFLDLFAGAGGIGIEAISRGASHVTFVEEDKKAALVIEENISLLKEKEKATIVINDVFVTLERLKKTGKTFDIIFADPPYGESANSLSNEVLKFVDTYPELLKNEGELFLEDALVASDEIFSLTNLQLKSSRRIGGARLRQYLKI